MSVYIYGSAILHPRCRILFYTTSQNWPKKNTEYYWTMFSISQYYAQYHEILNNTETRLLKLLNFVQYNSSVYMKRVIYIYIYIYIYIVLWYNTPGCIFYRECTHPSLQLGACVFECATWCVCVCARVCVYWLSPVTHPVATRTQRRLQPQHTQSCNWLYVYIAPGCILYIQCTQAGEQTGHAHTPGRAHHTPHYPRTHLVRHTPHTPGRAAHTRSCPLWHTPCCNQNTMEVATTTHTKLQLTHFLQRICLHPPWLQLVLAQLQLA
jgi:hypothetical protein